MTTKEILIKAREIYAANPSHAPLSELPAAGTYCVATAISEVSPKGMCIECVCALEKFLPFGRDGVVSYNATHTTDEVLALFDKAIEAEA